MGREPLLSAAEIAAVFGIGEIKNSILKLSLNNFDSAKTIRRLGGTIKIGDGLGADLAENELIEKIVAELKTVSGKINFGLSFYGENANLDLIEKWGKQIKNILKNENYSARYVFKREPILSSVTVDKNGLAERGREFLITQNQNKFSLAKTLAVQPFEAFGARDFGRPGRDDLSGMLPPKLALMMVNLAQIPLSGVILDPFCGSGTILTEALALGYKNLTGTDISDKAISDTKKNLEWVAKMSGIKYKPSDVELFQADITDLSAKIKHHSVDAIITESYLGKPLRGRETEEELRQQAEELKKLYLTSFEQFKKVLKKDSTVIFLIPRFRFKNNWITIDLKPAVEKLSFKTDQLLPGHDRLIYARPNQLVGREVWRFKNS